MIVGIVDSPFELLFTSLRVGSLELRSRDFIFAQLTRLDQLATSDGRPAVAPSQLRNALHHSLKGQVREQHVVGDCTASHRAE
ncbi:MAG: hypothetical protein IT307_20030 [Chloroflexi bacterium]|nr:hypothetical protein [Chloroflexota bacterium]